MTVLATLTYDEALELLTRAVEERGADYVYQQRDPEHGCVYFNETDDTPSCIIGHVLAYKGAAREDLGYANGGVSIDDLIDSGAVETDSRRTDTLLSVAQDQQDSGATWGQALASAMDAAAEE